MTTTVRSTFDDLQAMPDDGYRYELVRGEIPRMPPPKGEHPFIEAALVEAIGRYLYDRALSLGWTPSHGIAARNRLVGRVGCGEAGMRVTIPTDPDQVRGVDVGYVSAEQVGRIGPIPPKGYMPEAPALVVEVINASESVSYIEDKIADYFAAGAGLVWLLFPSRGTARACLPGGEMRSIPAEGMLDGGAVLPGFSLALREVFAI